MIQTGAITTPALRRVRLAVLEVRGMALENSHCGGVERLLKDEYSRITYGIVEWDDYSKEELSRRTSQGDEQENSLRKC